MNKVISVVEFARKSAKAGSQGQWDVALAALDAGEQAHPDARIPVGKGDKAREVTWAELRAAMQARKAQAEPSAVAEAETVAEQAPTVEPEQAPEHAQEPITAVETELPELTLQHTVEGGTLLLGSPGGEIGKVVSKVMGTNGQRWSFSFKISTTGKAGWYVRGSRDGGADMGRILRAQAALRDAGFPVKLDVHSTDEQGRTLAPNLSKAEQARRSHARSAEINSLSWHLSCTTDGLPCSQCGTAGLRPQTGKIVESPQGRMVVKCHDCAGAAQAEPVVEAPAAPVLPEQADDVEAGPAPTPAVAAPKSARSTRESAKRESVPATTAGLSGLDLDTLIALAALGRQDAVAEIHRRAGTARVAPAAAPKAPRNAPVSAVPVSAAPAVVPESGPIVFMVGITGNAKVRQTATDVRRNLHSQVTVPNQKYGVEINVFADRSARTLRVTISSAGASAEVRAKLVKLAHKATLRTLGVSELLEETHA